MDKLHNSFFLKHNKKYTVEIGSDAVGNTLRLSNALKELPKEIDRLSETINNLEKAISFAQEEVKKPWLYESELTEKNNRLVVLRKELDEKNLSNPNHEQENTMQKTEANNSLKEKNILEPTNKQKVSLLEKLSANREIVKQKTISSYPLAKKEVVL